MTEEKIIIKTLNVEYYDSDLYCYEFKGGGWGGGYIGINKTHPWYGKRKEEIKTKDIHGEITYSSFIHPRSKHKTKKDIWWIGFDTFRETDNEINWTKEKVRKETSKLKREAFKIAKENPNYRITLQEIKNRSDLALKQILEKKEIKNGTRD